MLDGDRAPSCARPRRSCCRRRSARPTTENAADVPDLSKTVPIRPPGFCTGCPERPIFAAMKLVEKELGKHQIAGDIGCHLFAALPPFEIGGATMGYGLGPASNAAFDGGGEKRADLDHRRRRVLAQRPVRPRSATRSSTSPTA